MTVSTRCSRCGRSTRSPKALVCRPCLGRAETRRWLEAGGTPMGTCALAQGAAEHSDGRYRIAVMSHDGEGATKTTATLHMLFNEEWGYETDHMTELRPSCGHWNCMHKGHWSPVTRVPDRVRLRRILAAWDEALSVRETGDLFSRGWPAFHAVMSETRDAVR